MLSQPGEGAHVAQSFPAGLPQPGMHVVPNRHGGRAPATLPRGLRENVEENVRGIPSEQRYGHDYLEIQKRSHIQGV